MEYGTSQIATNGDQIEIVEDDDYKVTIDYENLTTTFELK